MNRDAEKLSRPEPVRAAAPAGARREVDSADLFGDGRELHILHAGQVYTLRQTSKGKLILTK